MRSCARAAIIVRAVGGYGLPHCLRITVGTAEEVGLVVEALSAFMHRLPCVSLRRPRPVAELPGAEPLFRRLALIGVGLIGSSVARIARERGDLAAEVVACAPTARTLDAGRGTRASPTGWKKTRRAPWPAPTA